MAMRKTETVAQVRGWEGEMAYGRLHMDRESRKPLFLGQCWVYWSGLVTLTPKKLWPGFRSSDPIRRALRQPQSSRHKNAGRKKRPGFFGATVLTLSNRAA
jgi:hypothetical protein